MESLDLPLLVEADMDLPFEDEIDLGEFALALAEARDGAPPNLREWTGEGPRCWSCVHYEGKARGTCHLYRYPVEATDLCDDYEAKVEDQGDGAYTPPDNKRKV